MTPTTIQLDPETAKALADHAAAFGLSIEEYLKRHFPGENGVSAIDDPDGWLDELTADLPELPLLPPGFSTKDIYADHD